MPVLKKLRIRNFRSFGPSPLEIKFGKKVTIFIGPNNSGKSNLLRALRLLLSTPYLPLGKGEVEAALHDVHEGSLEVPTKNLELLNQMVGNCEISYSFTSQDLDRTVEEVFDSVYSYLKYDVDKERLVREMLSNVVSIYLETPFQSIGILERRGDTDVILKRMSTGPPWHLTDSTRLERINQYLRRIYELLGHQKNHGQILRAIIESTFPKLGSIPRNPTPINPQSRVPFKELRDSSPTPETLRDFLAMMHNDELKKRMDTVQFSRLAEVIQTGFPTVDNIDASIDPETNFARVLCGGHELGCQGDGLKQLLMFLVYLSYFKGDIVTVDEPERYLHPEIEASLIDYFLDFGTGQLVIATHSESIVNSVPSKFIDSEDVAIFGVVQDETRCTQIVQCTSSTIMEIFDKLGVPTNRYAKHMAALARTLVFVEGISDKIAIRKILKHHGKLKDLERFHPYFVPMGGIRNFTKIPPDIIDAIAKGDSEISSPMVPYLIVKDSDERIEKPRDHELVLSCREIENLVISEDAIRRVAKDYLIKLELPQRTGISVFRQILSNSIKRYIHKWSLLKMRSSLEKKVRKAMMWESISNEYDMGDDDILTVLEIDRIRVLASLAEIEKNLTEQELGSIQKNLLSNCFKKDGSLNYVYISKHMPGKDFIKMVMRETLIKTAQDIVSDKKGKQTISESKIIGVAGSISNLDSFLQHSKKLPNDLKKLLQKIEDVQTRSVE